MAKGIEVFLSEFDCLLLIVITSPHLVYGELHVLHHYLQLSDTLSSLIKQRVSVVVICLKLSNSVAVLIALMFGLTSLSSEASYFLA